MMRRVTLFVLAMCLALGMWQLALAQDEQAEPQAEAKVTLDVTSQAAADVAAELTKQTGVQVGVTSPCTATATVKVQDAKTEEAVKAFAEAIEASWIRAYVLESAPPPTPYTADQLFAGLDNQRQNWFDSFSDEERGKLFETWRAAGGFGRGGPGGPGGPPPAAGEPAPAAQPAAQQPAEMPGAGRSNMERRLREEAQQAAAAAGGQAAQPADGQGGPGGRGGPRLSDPVRQLIIPVRTETVTLNLDNAPLQQALFDLTTASGFIVAAGADLSGNITLQAENKPIDEVLDEIAAAAGAQWRAIYILAVPRELTQAEQEQRMEQGFQSRWTRYWAKPPEERAQEIQQGVERINQWAQGAQQNDERGQRAGWALQRFGPRMMSRLVRYSSGLTPEQRMELKPLLKAIGAALGQPAQ